MKDNLDVFIQWGESRDGYAGWPFISCATCGELFTNKDVDLVIEGAEYHVNEHPDHQFDAEL